MLRLGLLIFGSLGFAVSAQTLDSRESTARQRLIAIVLMAIAFMVANLGALAFLDA